MGGVRDQAAIDQDSGLKLDQLRVLAVVPSELTDIRRLPGMKRYVERGSGWKIGHETSHGRQAVGAIGIGKLCENGRVSRDFPTLFVVLLPPRPIRHDISSIEGDRDGRGQGTA